MNNTIKNLVSVVKSFKVANTMLKGKGENSHMLLEHIESFLYVAGKKEVILKDAQKDLGYCQAKCHRVFKHLKRLGWVDVVIYPEDLRQRLVLITKDGSDFLHYLGYKLKKELI